MDATMMDTGGYEEISGEAVEEYCTLTGADPITVYGELAAKGIMVFGLNETLVRPSWMGLNETLVRPSWVGLNETLVRPSWSVQGEDAEASAALAQAGRAAVACDGGCRCPKCGAALRLVLAPPPAVPVGGRAGVIVGAGQASKPVLRAGHGSCLCACPSCGTVLCLSIGPQGYDSRAVAKAAPQGYAAVAQAVHGDIDVFGVFA